MKKMMLMLLVLCIMSVSAFAQNENWFEKRDVFIGFDMKGTQVMDKAAGFVGIRTGLNLNEKWVIGFAGQALYFDRALSEVVNDGTYHLEAGFAGLFIERQIPLARRVKLNLSLLSANGLTQYRYDKEYREDKVWTEELIDVVRFQVLEPSVTLSFQMNPRLSLGLEGSFRNTSPVDLKDTDDTLFRKASAGISVKYFLFK